MPDRFCSSPAGRPGVDSAAAGTVPEQPQGEKSARPALPRNGRATGVERGETLTMWFLRRKSAGGPVAGAPASRHPAGTALRRLALAGLALATLGLEGCQSGGCDGCGPGTGFGSGIASSLNRMGQSMQNATSRIFNCKKCKGAGGDCCGGAMVEGAPVTGGGMIIEGTPGTVIPGSPPSAPSGERDPRMLEPVKPPGGASNVDPMGIQNRGRQSASLYRPRSIDSGVRGRGDDLARTSTSPNVDARRSTASSLLDNLPPVGDLPEEVARRSTSPIPPEADRARTAEPAPITPPLPGVASAREAELPAIKAGIDASSTPGIRRILSVRPKVSGGSLPSLVGLDWLKESGIKTLIDLRISNEVDPAFAEAVKARGFRYVALPIDTAKPEPDKVARFHDELGKTEGQPLYFFDTDGRRAGLLWYVHGLSYKSIDLTTANRDATELGLTDRATWLAAASYLDATKSLATGKADARPQPGPSASNGPSTLSSPLASWTRPSFNGSAANPVEAAR
jgi:protein tyrosine phosphatase (PTP) superfamily phosphohydrolase (DUF442 family)